MAPLVPPLLEVAESDSGDPVWVFTETGAYEGIIRTLDVLRLGFRRRANLMPGADTNEAWVFDAKSTDFVGTAATGTRPFGVAFDGMHAWVANRDDDTVSVIRIASLEVEDTIAIVDCSVYGSCAPHALAFDGSHIWVTHRGNGKVSIIDAQSRSIVEVIDLHGLLGFDRLSFNDLFLTAATCGSLAALTTKW